MEEQSFRGQYPDTLFKPFQGSIIDASLSWLAPDYQSVTCVPLLAVVKSRRASLKLARFSNVHSLINHIQEWIWHDQRM